MSVALRSSSGSESNENMKKNGEEVVVKKGAWTAEEDRVLVEYIEKNNGFGIGIRWRALPKLAG